MSAGSNFVLDAPDEFPSPHIGGSEMDQLAEALAGKFEELSLIYELTDRLKLGATSSEICVALLEQLTPCIKATTLAIELYPDEDSSYPGENYQAGDLLPSETLRGIAELATVVWSDERTSTDEREVIVLNTLESPTENLWNDPSLQSTQLKIVLVPIERRNEQLGYMIAIRPGGGAEFGTVEADLMRSTTMMLAVHLINHRQYLELQQMFEGTVRSLVSALDAKDAYTCGHSSRVAELAVELAQRLGYDEQSISRIRMAGILHDIGKIGVEDSVLQKPGRLTDEEFDKIKQHPVLGYEILKGIKPFRDILPAVRHHHEAWDGTGYPDGLSGNSIPRDAQVIAVADAFDAMTSDRPYRPGMPLARVVEIFRRGRGQQWASDVVDVLFQCEQWLEEAK